VGSVAISYWEGLPYAARAIALMEVGIVEAIVLRPRLIVSTVLFWVSLMGGTVLLNTDLGV